MRLSSKSLLDAARRNASALPACSNSWPSKADVAHSGMSFAPQQIMRELSFQLPEASIAVEATEAQRLFEELDRLGVRPTGQDYARLARRVGTAARERSVNAVELLDVAENEKVLRALEHLAARDELSAGLVSLWDGLTGDVRPAPVTYRIHLVHLDGREEPRELTSLSGSYSVGDLIPAPAGECWQVVSVRPEDDGLTGLMCDPC